MIRRCALVGLRAASSFTPHLPASTLTAYLPVRGFSSKKRKNKYKHKPSADDPYLKDVLRQFYKKVHPDLFGRYPELKESNEVNLQALMSLLDYMKSNNSEFVPVKTEKLHFFVRTDKADHFMKVPITIRTTGNNCHHVVAESLSKLFTRCGLPSSFQWGDNYWDKKIIIEKNPAEEEE